MLKIEKTFFHEILLKNHHFHADYLEIDYPGLVGQSWLKVNFSLQLDRILTYGNRPKIDPSTVLNFDNGQVREKSVDITGKGAFN